MPRQIVIIGAGASGLMAAIAAASEGASVTILEQNEKPGKKLLATGNGKCNLTNTDLDPGYYHSDDPEKAAAVLKMFTVKDTLRFFRNLGLRVFDRQGWVYPTTEQAASVLNLLLWEAERLGVHFKNREEVTAVYPDIKEGPWIIRTASWQYRADAVILSCGSRASSVRGSSDTAIRMADAIGIPRHPFLPVLVPLRIKETAVSSWNGTRVHAAVTLLINGSRAATETGELQMTAYGLSGIPIFQLSRIAVPALYEDAAVQVLLDFLPEMTSEEVEDEWRMRQANAPEKTNLQLLTGMIPEKIIPVVLSHAGLRAHDLPHLADHAEGGPVDRLMVCLKKFPLTITGTAAYEQAQVCTGGIALSALTETLECRKYPGLYVSGEAVHVDGPCGGYNLQWAWSSGYTAGCAAAKR